MKYSRSEIRSAYVAADRLVNSGRCTGDDVFAITRPFHDCTEVEGISPQFQRDSIGLLYALTGDGYRVAKRYRESAEWYRKASGFTCIHGEVYAHMVWKNRLSAHYDAALETAKRRKKKEPRASILARVGEALSKPSLLLDRDWIEIVLARASTMRHLEAAVAKNA